jgi:hypothetical protein
MAVASDPEIIQRLANGLYRQAAMIEVFYLLGGLIAGWFVTQAAIGVFVPLLMSQSSLIVAVIGLLLGAWVGHSLGASKAYMLRLMAQFALLQVDVAKNTYDTALALRRDRVRGPGESPLNAISG